MKNIDEMHLSPRPWVVRKVDGNGSYGVCETLNEMLFPMNLDVSRDTAKLISAAPELYEALWIVFNSINEIQEHHRKTHTDGDETCDDCVHFVKWLKMAKAALEKAGGEDE